MSDKEKRIAVIGILVENEESVSKLNEILHEYRTYIIGRMGIPYKEKNIKRIPLDVQKEKYEEIKAAAEAAGESVNGYIKTAVDMRMETKT